MTEPEPDLPLAADFPPPTREQWRRLVDSALKGMPFERLIGSTYDGIAIEPLAARRPDARPIAARAGSTPWQVMARIDHPDPGLANRIAIEELENGAAGLTLVFAGAVGDYGFGLPANQEALARVLEGVDLASGIAIELDLSPHAEAEVDAALAKGWLLSAVTRSPASGNIRLGHDPLGAIALSGGAKRRFAEVAPHFARRLAALARDGLRRQLASADGRIIHNAGGSEAQELAFVLASALAYLRALEAEGMPLDAARRLIFFRLAADADQFLTIAKFRSLRKLWARVESACGLAPEPTFIAAETAWRMMARRDPQVNILRSTIAVSSAALGGADAIAVLPFSAASGLPDSFARRIARNSQLILLEESHLDKVADPAAGSGAVEHLTDRLCHAAWTLLQEIEAAGGAAAALQAGLIRNEVAAVRAARRTAIACEKDGITGVSIFPDLGEAASAFGVETSFSAAHSRVSRGPPAPPASRTREDEPTALAPLRLAEPFESLRDASDRVLAATRARPKIFLATLGAPDEFSVSAAFAKNFFEAGGIEAAYDEVAASADVAAFKSSGAEMACLCGSDARDAAGVAAALKAAGARRVYLAGRPGAREAVLRQAGVDTFVFAGCDALAVLQEAHRLIAS
jgi:methylmalonyl-CoA mutase